jgi:two-component system, OmpR family, response regulator MprA
LTAQSGDDGTGGVLPRKEHEVRLRKSEQWRSFLLLPDAVSLTIIVRSLARVPSGEAWKGETMARILVIDDEPQITDFLRRGLIYKGFSVDVAYDGKSGLDRALEAPPDLVILDLMLPDIDGLDVCQRLRSAAKDDLPVLMLTAKDATADKIAGLDAGADDYITKPFSFEELLARVRAALRRKKPSSGESQVLKVGDLAINTASRGVSRGDRLVDLTAREYDLLEFLARNTGHVVTKETIFEKVWGYDFELESDAIKVYISYLRTKLNALGEPDLIHTVRGVGYMLKE